MSAFMETFSTTDGRSQSMQSGSHPWTGLGSRLRLENLVMTGACLSSNEKRVVLYENRRESRDSARLVMRGITAHRGWSA